MVQTLAHNSTATLSVIRDYLVQKLQKQSQQIAQDELRVRRYREETTRIRQEIQELKARYLASGCVEALGLTLFFTGYHYFSHGVPWWPGSSGSNVVTVWDGVRSLI